MALIIEAPNEVYSVENELNDKLFLAGGITNCPNWNDEVIENLNDISTLTIYNPRRKNFPIDDPNAAEQQISWEFNHLRCCNIISFWFPKETLCPITLFELGRWGYSQHDKKIFVGMHPEYKRKDDVIIQGFLSSDGLLPIFYNSISDLSNAIKDYLTSD